MPRPVPAPMTPPGDQGPTGTLRDPTADPGDDSVTTVVSGGTGEQGTGAAAGAEVDADDESEPTRSE